MFALSYIKIRKNFNWLTTGIFTLTVISMPQLMYYSIELRMYSWTVFFITAMFIYSYEIINEEKNIKNWIIFILLTIAAIYTHYYCIIASGLIYLYIFRKFFKDNKNELKTWLISSIIVIISYIPWISILIQQTKNTVEGYWIPPITFQELLDVIFFTVSPENKIIYGTENPIISIFGILLLIGILILILNYFKSDKDRQSNMLSIAF